MFPSSFWRMLAAVVATAATAVLVEDYLGTNPAGKREKPEETGRWESEGGFVPGANLAEQESREARFGTGAAEASSSIIGGDTPSDGATTYNSNLGGRADFPTA